MEIPVQITFRDMPPSEALEASVREHAEKLEHFYDRIIRCRVVVEAPHRHHHKGKLYHVRIDMTVPGGEIVVNREPHAHEEHSDAYVAIRDAFNAAGRQLEDFLRKQRGQVKTHEEVPHEHGRVSRLFPTDDYGFIQTADGREVYFHRNSLVAEDFDRLVVGSEVRVVVAENESDKGPQATTVTLVSKA